MDCDRSEDARVYPIDGKRPSETVIEAVAAAEGDDPFALSPLHGAVDPDSLDKLLERQDENVVRFPYEGYTVTVCGETEVVLDPRG